MTFLDGVLVDRVDAEAKSHQVDWGRLLLTLLAGLFYAVGWVAAKGFNMLARLGTAMVWAASAVRLGWREGRRVAAART